MSKEIITQNVYARLNTLLNMIQTLEEDYAKQENNYLKKKARHINEPFKPGTIQLLESKLAIAGASIRELRLDAQRIALQAGEEVAVWWAKRNHEVLN